VTGRTKAPGNTLNKMPSLCNFAVLKTTFSLFLSIKNYPAWQAACKISACLTGASPNNCQLFVNKRWKSGKSTVAGNDTRAVAAARFFCTKVFRRAVFGREIVAESDTLEACLR